MTFVEFERRCLDAGDPPFSINEAAWAAECSCLPILLFLIAYGEMK